MTYFTDSEEFIYFTVPFSDPEDDEEQVVPGQQQPSALDDDFEHPDFMYDELSNDLLRRHPKLLIGRVSPQPQAAKVQPVQQAAVDEHQEGQQAQQQVQEQSSQSKAAETTGKAAETEEKSSSAAPALRDNESSV